jgi:hypothetical protein
MKKFAILGLVIVMLAVSVSTVTAAKPQSVIPLSNGFPSGLHFNLNIHGKDPLTFTCDSGSGGNSVFLPEYGEAIIEYYSDKRTNGTQLVVEDACAMPVEQGGQIVPGTARVKIPWQVLPDEETEPVNVTGYWVFARILGKPNNGKKCTNGDGTCPSSIILYPNVVIEAVNDSTSMMPLGLITRKDVYVATPEGFVRFDPEETRGKGSKAQDITRLFSWSGWVCWGENPDLDGDGDVDGDDLVLAAALPYWGDVPDLDGSGTISVDEWIYFHPDTNGDGVIDETDVPSAAAVPPADSDSNGTITLDEWLEYQETLGHATHYTNEWVFNIADYVVTQQQVDNDGTKLLQIRFYPFETTAYEPPTRIIVGKLTDPTGAEQSFEFSTDYSANFSLKDGEAHISDSLAPGTYSVTELVPSGWQIADVSIIDPDGGSPAWTSGNTVNIDLDKGETVYVTFINTESTP